MTNLIKFPGRRMPSPPIAPTDELTTLEIELTRAQIARVRAETRQTNIYWFWYHFKRLAFWAIVLWLLFVAFGAKAEPPQPPEARTVSHNGSLMRVEQLPDRTVQISYLQPRPSLWAVGVVPGTVLLRGRWVNGQFEALAQVFTHSCGPIPYLVKGAQSTGGVLTLVGAAPVIETYLCIVLGLTWDSANTTLIFGPA